MSGDYSLDGLFMIGIDSVKYLYIYVNLGLVFICKVRISFCKFVNFFGLKSVIDEFLYFEY